MPDVVLAIAFGWITLLLCAGGVLLLRSKDTLHRVLALDVLVVLVIALLTRCPTGATSRTTSTRRSRSRCCRSPPRSSPPTTSGARGRC